MNILVVGAGAVGQVYALHLAKAGHRISFFVKEKYAPDLRGGLVLHRLGRRTVTEKLAGYGIVTSAAEVATGRWDQVWLALSSDALRGELAASVLAAVGKATVVCLQPDIGDGERVRRIVPPEQVVQGMIPFISFHSPLPGKSGPDGMAYYLPPMTPTLLAGEPACTESLFSALKAGGLRAKRVPDFARATAATTAMFQCMIATLESNGWDLSGLPRSAVLPQGLAAAREAITAVAAQTGATTLPMRPLLHPLAWRLLMPLVPHVFPFDIEVYLQYHFSKVGVQTRLMLDSYIALAEARGMPSTALRRLRAGLPTRHEERPL